MILTRYAFLYVLLLSFKSEAGKEMEELLEKASIVQKIFSEQYISKKQVFDEEHMSFVENVGDPADFLEKIGVTREADSFLSQNVLSSEDLSKADLSLDENENLVSEDKPVLVLPDQLPRDVQWENRQILQNLIDHRALEKKLARCRQKISFFNSFKEILERFEQAVTDEPQAFHFMDWNIFKRNFYAFPLKDLPFRLSNCKEEEFAFLRKFLKQQIRLRYVLGFEHLNQEHQRKWVPLIGNVIETLQKTLPRFLSRLIFTSEFMKHLISKSCMDFLTTKLSPHKIQTARLVVDEFLPLFLKRMRQVQGDALEKKKEETVCSSFLGNIQEFQEGLKVLQTLLVSEETLNQ